MRFIYDFDVLENCRVHRCQDIIIMVGGNIIIRQNFDRLALKSAG